MVEKPIAAKRPRNDYLVVYIENVNLPSVYIHVFDIQTGGRCPYIVYPTSL